MIIIGISGKKHSGKTTLARFGTELIKAPTATIAFADSLKEEVAKACGVTVDYLEVNKTLFRPILQWWGSEWRRKQNPNYWIEKVGEKILALPDNIMCVFIPDVRFINEANWVTGLGGYIVRVERTGFNKKKDEHLSETELDTYKPFHFICNTNGIEMLKTKTKDLLYMINKEHQPKCQVKI